jgi:hypothetical protein
MATMVQNDEIEISRLELGLWKTNVYINTLP